MLNDFFSIAGHYRVTAGGTVADAISMNYDRKESDPACLSPERSSLPSTGII